ncbi:MAG: Fe-S cluster assembly protein SufD [Ilumatobacter sp.]|uniref:Fe-S cluster assembly protein SufD n=1 Tax=Ilumatobacter sp. TaxID=1967498 RepID=UPI002608C8E3|nr:Fe-S cluster assembly protein SufD [Ilumatobacter sp.]MDJ0771720.1 Fe-S cluster assembly protein SufD [Ilumatobacter sp.]
MSVLDLDRLDAIELPTPDEEIWRYSRIADLDLAAHHLAEHVPTIEGPDDVLRANVVVGGEVIDRFDGETPDVFASINRESASQVAVTVPAGVTVADAIVITHTVPAGGALVCPRLVIEAGADSQVTVVERFVSAADGAALVVPVLQLVAGPAARVNYLAVNELSDDAWSIGHQQAVGERDSTTLLATVALGGDYARVRTEARVSGAGASTRQVALYFAGDHQMHDFRTIQDHDAPHTTSDLLFKGAVQDEAVSVYTGLIKIREHAGGTSAHQTNRNLTLSEGAWAESVPNLDIRTNDVKCSHASTVGPIDEEQRFYLESRGIRPEVAERLVVLGFFDEVLSQLPAPDLAAGLRERVAAKLNIGTEVTA